MRFVKSSSLAHLGQDYYNGRYRQDTKTKNLNPKKELHRKDIDKTPRFKNLNPPKNKIVCLSVFSNTTQKTTN